MFATSRADRLRQLAKEMISNSGDWARTGQELARTGSHRAKRFIYRKPMAATVIGLAVGYVIGRLFSNKKSPATLPAPVKGAKRGR
jgi:ElaB/YqjD/DUF883 family membrane-anchored ribosome-binding protein